MFTYQKKPWFILPLLAVLFAACSSKLTTTPTETLSNISGMPNPASAYCEEQGGKVEIRDGEPGQYGICIFPEGGGCDEWALFHNICKRGDKDTASLEGITASYVNLNYGFTINPSQAWTIEDRIDSLLLTRPDSYLLIGFKPSGRFLPLFRTGVPAGDFVDGGEFLWLGSPAHKNLLVYEDQIMMVDFCQQGQEGCLKAGDLEFFIWLDLFGEKTASNIAAEEIAEAQSVVESLTLLEK